MTMGDGSQWLYQYDALGEVISGKRYWPDSAAVPGEQYEYGYDDIGNRKVTKVGGDQAGGNLRSASYLANALNQVTNRTVPGTVDILGLASPGTSVTVNSAAADYRRGEFFDKRLSINNATGSAWQSVSVSAGGTAQTGNIFVPPASENFTYDVDGNLLTDGRWTYTWDGENRLIQMQGLSSGPSGSLRKLVFEYDALGRRIAKQVYIWNGTAYPSAPNTILRFVYDGWNLLGELDGNNNLIRSYQWGTDLSGTMQGAGGVGGLVLVKPTGSNPQFAVYDGNGNVAGFVDGSMGLTSANFEYGPFGETIRQSGSQAATPIRFSTKYQDDETGLIYYAFRYYNSDTGRWINRDPITENGGVNLYGMVRNNLIQWIDSLGLVDFFFAQQRGSFDSFQLIPGVGGAVGVWGQNSWNANGDYSGVGCSGTTSVSVSSSDHLGSRNNQCNSITPKSPVISGDPNSGTLVLVMKNASPGLYRVVLDITLEASVEVNKTSTAGATWRTPASTSLNGGVSIKGKGPQIKAQFKSQRIVVVNVNVAASSQSDVVTYISPKIVTTTGENTCGFGKGSVSGTIVVRGFQDPSGNITSNPSCSHQY